MKVIGVSAHCRIMTSQFQRFLVWGRAGSMRVANVMAMIVPTMAAYATDGAVFRKHGIPTYGVGSTFAKNSDEFAHGLDERIPVASFYSGLVHWDVLIKTLAGHR